MPLAILAASFSASSISMVSAARSTRLTTSPMPRMRPATRSGWKASSLSSASPTPANLIGLPVTARIDSAAPPRASPSMRVRITPVRSTSPAKPLATLTASWPVRLSTTSRVSVGFEALRDRLHLGHQRIVDVEAAGGVEQDDVIGLQLGRLDRALGDIDRLLAGDDRQRVDVGLAPEHRQLLLRRRAGDVERGHQHPLALALRQALGELGGGGRLARALEADHHDHGRRIDVEVELGGLGAERLDQGVVDDLDDHLARRDRADALPAPTARSVTLSTKSRATGSATSASSSATRTSRIAARTSASVSAPRPRSRSKTLPSRSLRLSNIQISQSMFGPIWGRKTQNTPADETSSAGVHPRALIIDVVSKRRARPSGCSGLNQLSRGFPFGGLRGRDGPPGPRGPLPGPSPSGRGGPRRPWP